VITARDVAKDVPASIVVFLVALPLCMGIAIASGTPPALGLLTGIVGGLLVGFIAGSPLQVSGPAAGLAVLVLELVREHGLEALGPVVLVAGVIQVLAGLAGVGQWFRAISPAVIHGMLAGIGVLIFLSQFHVMLDGRPPGSGLENLLGLPDAVRSGLSISPSPVHQQAAIAGLVTIAVIVLWNNFRPAALKVLPGPLLAVIAGALIVNLMQWEVSFVVVPANLFEALNVPKAESFGLLGYAGLFEWGLMFAFVASAETLLCAAAVDRMHDGPRTRYNQEMVAQGVGNAVCGVLGALPMTGVIVRSSANVQSGGRTRASAIMHGVWLLAFVVALPWVLNLIPTAGLAAILVYTGYKLVDIGKAREIAAFGRSELAIYLVTLFGIVTFDLLTGVVNGVLLALVKIIYAFAHVEVQVVHHPENPRRVDVLLSGSATFLGIPRISRALAAVPPGTEVHLLLQEVLHVDHACLEVLADFERLHEQTGGTVQVEWSALREHLGGPRRKMVARSAADVAPTP
jgi:MFS superfamily sulfate permease-like transporter